MKSNKKLPYLLQYSEHFLSSNENQPSLRYAFRNMFMTKKSVPAYRSIFAYKIPYLPDKLDSPHMIGNSNQERLAEVLDQNVRIITNLSKRKDLAFALRFHAVPEIGEIKIILLVRHIGSSKLTAQAYQHFAMDVKTVFNSFNYQVEPVLSETNLRDALSPISKPMVLEIRQHEELAAMTHGDAYVVYPFHLILF